MSKLLVLYVFHKMNDRVNHFIKNCIFFDKNIDFIIISNGQNNKFDVPPYVKTLFRDNIGFDNGGWSDALLTNNLYKNYDKFIFVNSSVIGPFLPSDYKGRWTDIYINGLKGDVKLFGSTINTSRCPLSRTHLQSYIFSMDKITLEFLIKCEIFSMTNYAKNFNEAIFQKEVLMSRKIIENNWNIGSLLSYYKDVDFRNKKHQYKDFKKCCKYGCLMQHRYKDKLWTLQELVFIKGNRLNWKNFV
jgi:hypothetical protein